MTLPFIYTPQSVLCSNVYSSLDSFRRIGIIPSSESDVDYAKWQGHPSPQFKASDTELMEAAYRQSRWIDKICATWFYPRDLRIPFSLNDLHGDELYLSAPCLNQGQSVLTIIDHRGQAQKVSLGTDFWVRSEQVDIDGCLVKLVLAPGLSRRLRQVASLIDTDILNWESIWFDSTFEWYAHFDGSRHYGVFEGCLGFIEDDGVPIAIQDVCRYLTVKNMKNERYGDVDGDQRAFIKTEITDGHSYTIGDVDDLAKYRDGVVITGTHWVDQALSSYIWQQPAFFEII